MSDLCQGRGTVSVTGVVMQRMRAGRAVWLLVVRSSIQKGTTDGEQDLIHG